MTGTTDCIRDDRYKIDAAGRPRHGGITAFRFEYQKRFGPLPTRIQVHHLCGNKWCMNLDHAEAIEMSAHTALHQAERIAPTSCPNGHPYNEENEIGYAQGTRRCRICYLAARERVRRRRGAKAGTVGVDNPHAKLTEADVRAIRELHAGGATNTWLARMYPVNDRSISNIIKRKTWRHVE